MKKLLLEPLGETALVTTGTPLLAALLAKDMNVLMSCGGKGICSTCHVKVCEGMDQLSPVQTKERRTLSLVADTTSESRLACQAQVYGDGIVVRVPEGMYIESAEDLRSLLGTTAPENFLHPISGALLIPKGKLITRTLLEQSRQVEADLAKLRDSGDTVHTQTKTHFCASGIATRPNLSGTTKIAAKTSVTVTPVPRSQPVIEPPKPQRKPTPIVKKPALAVKEPTTGSSFNASPGTEKLQPTMYVSAQSMTAPTAAPKSSETLRAGVQIDKYLLLEQVGKGGAGIVYRALHTKLKTLVAIKFLRTDAGNLNEDHLVREAQLLAQLTHPNVVRVIDFEDHPTRPYVVMEFVDGLSASDLVKQSGRVAPRRALEIAIDVASGLEAAWALGIVHRDVKPGNILVTRNGRSKLVDLGLATFTKAGEAHEAGTIPVEGTVGYMAPEVIAGSSVDHRSDMYSLGATLFHLMAGRLPFIGRSSNEVVLQHMQLAPPDLHEVVSEVPMSIASLILKLMAKNPKSRFEDYADLIVELKTLKQELSESHSELAGVN